MYEDDAPQADTELAFVFAEDTLRVRVVVEPELDSQSDQAADKTPERPSLPLQTQ